MKYFKRAAAVIICCALILSGCGGSGGKDEEKITYTLYPISYEDVNIETDMVKFLNENRTDGKLDYGFVKSIWHTLKVNGEDVAVYSARCGKNVHSFAWLDVKTNAENGSLELNAELKLITKDKSEAIILPEKLNEAAYYDDGTVTATLKEYGSHTFVFDKQPDKAVTLYVAPYSEFMVPQGYTERKIKAGEYGVEETSFTEQNTVYHFEGGVFDVTSISLPSNSILYFDRGAYVRVYEAFDGDHHGALITNGTENVKVCGRALFDFSACTGGVEKTKSAYGFSNVKNLEVEGIITVNSNNWTMCVDASDNAFISRCMFFGYRTFSDGIMLSDCMNSGARDNFVRTGDDGIEVKSFSGNADPNVYTKNILYENNCVWTDKGIGYGCIYECRKKVDGVVFKNNSVGFAQAAWSDHLGVCTMQMGSQKGITWQNVYFENMEVYSASCALVSIFNRADNADEGGVIKNIYCKNINLKHATETTRTVYALSVIIKLANGVEGGNCKINGIYLDNVNFAGKSITAENFEENTYISIAEKAVFNKSTIKINTCV